MSHAIRKLAILSMLLALYCAAYGAVPDSGALSVCEVLSHPAEYIGQTVTLQGEVFSAPPHIPLQLLGLCKGGIDVILPGKHDKFVDDALFKEFDQDTWKLRAHAMVASLFGTIKTDQSGAGPSLMLYLKAVKDIHFAPRIWAVGANLPAFGLFATLPAKPESISLLITVTKGVVTDARVEKHTGDSLEQLALENVKTWKFAFFQSGTFTTLFSYRIAKATTLPLPVNPIIEMNLPSEVVITRLER